MENFSLRIQHRTKPRTRPETMSRDPFLLDVENGFISYVATIVSAAIASSSEQAAQPRPRFYPLNTAAPTITTTTTATSKTASLIYLAPTPRLTATGCWCPDPSRPRPHCWRTCTRFVPQAIVAPSATIQACRHVPSSAASFDSDALRLKSTTSTNNDTRSNSNTYPIDHLFCFDPVAAASMYMTWFLAVPGPPTDPPAEDDAARLGAWLLDLYYSDDHYRAHGLANPYLALARTTSQPLLRPPHPHLHPQSHPRSLRSSPWGQVPSTNELAETHYALLSRLFVELRGSPPKASRCGAWYDAERVHAVIRWDRLSVRESIDAFLPFVLRAKAERLMQTYGQPRRESTCMLATSSMTT